MKQFIIVSSVVIWCLFLVYLAPVSVMAADTPGKAQPTIEQRINDQQILIFSIEQREKYLEKWWGETRTEKNAARQVLADLLAEQAKAKSGAANKPEKEVKKEVKQ